MMQLVTPENYTQFRDALADMHRLRFRVFKERLGWAVHAEYGTERDRFDALEPVYLLHRGNDDRLHGCVRLLPSTGPTILRDVFPQLLGGNPCPSDPRIWESNRFALELSQAMPRTENGLATSTFELFAGMIEFGLSDTTFSDGQCSFSSKSLSDFPSVSFILHYTYYSRSHYSRFCRRLPL